MAIDFSQLPTLIGPRFKQLRAERGDRERLARSKHAKRKRPKNHSTNRKRSYLERTRAAEVSARVEKRREDWYLLKQKIRAYWRGEIDNLPQAP